MARHSARLWFVNLALFCGLASAPPPLTAQETQPAKSSAQAATASADQGQGSQYVRVRRDGEGTPLALETAIITFVPADGRPGPVVELVGAVHIADRTYYEQLNQIFRKYDALLFELVAPKGVKIPKGGGQPNGSPVSALQRAMRDQLGLAFQLECVDYTAKNFVHADMTDTEFAASMRKRNDWFKLIFRSVGQAAAMQGRESMRGSNVRLLQALMSDNDDSNELKIVIAEQFENVDGSLAALEGDDGSTLISLRNAKAFEVLRQQINAGKKQLGVFYGAGHLADMQQRLEKEFGLKVQATRWLKAWDLQ